ncbi:MULTISPECIES: ABC-three component system middle component 2 [unclassified Crossiella]|uniref:ABC-three component system middle component 2 n=1 Tax=unclassified Crossiella TaxID=2620835 RepID=UPI001FFF633A|nr:MULTISPECIES: ABC-three component system middle component 2 [unclassified Crossiella]MCK2237398.1 threonine transporter [Crossiella sp. S99.2]MCK2251053.1 threonine transporter [Crossiella sp. S99.1]
MRSPLNGPLEYGVRVLVMLTEAYPKQLDINHLVLLDHSVLHTAELGGPPSIHPPHPLHAGELGVRRASVEEGLRVMLRARLADMRASSAGICYEAGNEAHSFISALASSYISELRDRSRWVVEQFGTLSEVEIRRQTAAIFGSRPDDDDTGDREREEGIWSG